MLMITSLSPAMTRSGILRTIPGILTLGMMLGVSAAAAASDPGASASTSPALFTVTYKYPDACQMSPAKWLMPDRKMEMNQYPGEATRGYFVPDAKTLVKYAGTIGNGSSSLKGGSKYGHIKYDLEYAAPVTQAGVVTATVSGLKQQAAQKPFDLFQSRYEVTEFTIAEAVEYLTNAIRVECNMEITADFPVESVRANFQRLLPAFNASTVYPTRSKLTTINLNPEWTRFQQQGTLVFVIDETPVLLVPTFVPYRNGSKALVRVLIPANTRQGDIVDFTAIHAAVRTALTKIVND